MRTRTAGHSALALLGFLAASFAVSALGGLATASSINTWYPTLTKPSFNPPDWLFGPVWTTLYIMIAVAGWRVWRRVAVEYFRWRRPDAVLISDYDKGWLDEATIRRAVEYCRERGVPQ